MEQQIEDSLDGLNIGEIFKAAVESVNEVGLGTFLSNPIANIKKMTAKSMVKLAERNQLPQSTINNQLGTGDDKN